MFSVQKVGLLCMIVSLSLATPAMYGSKTKVGQGAGDEYGDSGKDMKDMSSSDHQPMSTMTKTSKHSSNPGEHNIFTFAFCGQWRPYHFTDESGRLTGFSVDLMQEICDAAGQMCSMVYIHNATECWDSGAMRSQGLNDRWYDAVVDMQDTRGRGLTHAFSGGVAYTAEPPAFLYAKRSSSVLTYDKTKHTVGYARGNWLDEYCLKSMSMTGHRDLLTTDSYDDLMTSLDRGQIDVAFMEERVANGYRKVSDQLKCSKSGNSIMNRKDMAYKLYWIKDGLAELKTSGKYDRLCYIASKAYGGDPGCKKM